MVPCSRRLYLIHAVVTSGLSAAITRWPVVGFADTGPTPDAPMIMPNTGDQIAIVASSMITLNGAAPAPLDAFYDGDLNVYVIDEQEIPPEGIKQYLRAL